MIRIRMRRLRRAWLLGGLVWAGGFGAVVLNANIDGLLTRAQQTFAKGDHAQAANLIAQAIAAEPRNPKGYFVRGQFHEAERQPAPAIDDFTHALELAPNLGPIYQHRGGAYFKLGKIDAALADFNEAIRFAPQLEPYFWQRGVADYYAGRYVDGRHQFELYQTVNPNDVENAAWHFLCVARASGPAAARAALLKVKSDPRSPMMAIYALLAGTGTADDVLLAAKKAAPGSDTLKRQLFYAHFYLGLYYEAVGNRPAAREHIFQAADRYRIDDYMGDVAKVHAERLRKTDPR